MRLATHGWLVVLCAVAGTVRMAGGQEAGGAQDRQPAKTPQKAAATAPAEKANQHPWFFVRLQNDGALHGRVNAVDPSSLKLKPVSNAHVLFIQQGKIVSEAISGPKGDFVATGLSPRAVYTMVTRTADRPGSIAVAAVVVLPADVAALNDGDDTTPVAFARLMRTMGVRQAEAMVVVALAPATDLAAAGVGDDTGAAPAISSPAPTTAGGGGGGGAGGTDGAALLGAMAVAAGVAAAIADESKASPFTP